MICNMGNICELCGLRVIALKLILPYLFILFLGQPEKIPSPEYTIAGRVAQLQ